MSLADVITELQPEIVRIRRDLHAHPELAFAEQRTAGIVADYLDALAPFGLEMFCGIAKTGVVARLRVGKGSGVIGLRADMDALPLEEMNDFAHRSVNPKRMHACGHDGHTAMLLGAAAALCKTRNFDGTVYFIFQPAEEHDGGGRVMVEEEKLFERFPMQMVFGLHNWPVLPAGQFGVIEGPVMAATDCFELTVVGRGGHAAMPHQVVDTVLAGSALVQALQSLISRNTDPLEAAVVSVTRFNAGFADNILPEQAVLGGTVRSLTPEMRAALQAGMHRVCSGIEATYGVRIKIRYEHGYPPTINSTQPTALCRAAARAVVGDAAVLTSLHPSMGAEDFAYMSRAVPGCYVWLGNGVREGAGTGGCMLHSPHFDFNDDVIGTGIRYWVQLTESVLK